MIKKSVENGNIGTGALTNGKAHQLPDKTGFLPVIPQIWPSFVNFDVSNFFLNCLENIDLELEWV